jgi:hypothetical protein
MLYPINPPSCSPALDWAVQLQTDLITALCDANTTPAMVTPQWVRALRPNPQKIGTWLERFAAQTFEKKKLMDAMLDIARLDDNAKARVLNYVANNYCFTDAFVPGRNPPATNDVSVVGTEVTQSALKTILNAFYGLGLADKKGFPVDANGCSGHCTTRSLFVGMFKNENNIEVCPLCEGDLNGAEVDHWLPASKYPALSCNPRNLVPICHDCNSRANKRDKPPLSAGQARPFDDWFHPYERPAAGQFSIEILGGKSVQLTNADTLQQTRLNNLDNLINLSRRWSDVYQQQKEDYLRKLVGKVRRGHITADAAALLKTVGEWIAEIADTRFDRRYSLIKLRILQAVQNVGSPDFNAWLQHMNDAVH